MNSGIELQLKLNNQQLQLLNEASYKIDETYKEVGTELIKMIQNQFPISAEGRQGARYERSSRNGAFSL